ncbi:MAG: hypothetical protein NTW22_04935 [Proteobacteria bacterium]|jgi:hypothetical protein|nr:hypothetical protein [Pseudomonadota bacterium]
MKNMLKVLRIILVLTAAMQVSAGAPENDQEIHENPDRMKYRPLTIQDSINDRFPENTTHFQQIVALLMHRLANPLLAIENAGN